MGIIVKYIDLEEAVDYVPSEHKRLSCKFIYFPKEILGWKDDLLAIGSYRIHEHKHVRIYTNRLLGGLFKEEPWPVPTGVGECRDGRVVDWKSWGLNITTPRELRPIIENALGMTSR